MSEPERPISIEDLPGFETFCLWIEALFAPVREDIIELKDDIKDVKKGLNEGNGKPSLKEQVNLNTKYREAQEEEARDLKKTLRSVKLTFACSLVMLLLNVLVTLFAK